VAYSAIANGGRIVTPHVGLRVEEADGRILQRIEPGPRRRIHVSSENRSAILSGLRAAANDPGGTSAPVFQGFPITVAGKTGTAERGAQGDQSWYAAIAPYNDPRIVVAVTIERGGFGAEAAAPAARRILAAYFGIKGKKAVGQAGSSPD
jgi:penicillin-binding protein 2